ncbi:hypothetical protein [Synechocystis sp. LKSZ1]|uniref:hypothetical protein n=1 Tax=Synechocystis sp. LKSZ1 TaxID=3144951 RepID=UPI00336C20EF
MAPRTPDLQILQTATLLTCYGFDLKGLTPRFLLEHWLQQFSPQWIRLAVLEALYQGRYKAVSVEHLLNFWGQRGQPNFHFNHDFERLVSQKLPHRGPLALSPSAPEAPAATPPRSALPRVEVLSSPPRPRSIDHFTPTVTESDLFQKLQTALNQL